jgi:hypothetical protein
MNHFRRIVMRRLAMFVFFVVFAAFARAQFDTATVLGTVTDPSGAVVPHCQVALHNTATGAQATVSTDDRGEFRFVDISIGAYELKVTAQGFQPATAKFELTVGAHQRVDVSLKVATAATTVTTTANVTQLETESSERGQVVNEREIAELPLNGREYSQLVELTAGVVPSPSELGESYNQREGSFDINGLRSVFNNYMLDGLDNNFYGTSNQGFSNQVVQLSPDAVAEFQVVTNNMSAEFGRSGGATINVVTRYGTNELHGRAWEFLRNTALDASGYFKPNPNAAGQIQKPALHQNQFGVTLGGPLKKDKLFFFADYEGSRRSSSSTADSTLPTDAERGLTCTGTNGAGTCSPSGYYLIDNPGVGNGYLPVDNPCPYVGPVGGPMSTAANVNPCTSTTWFGIGLGQGGTTAQAYYGGTQYLNPPYAAHAGIPAGAVIPYAATIMEGNDSSGNLYLPRTNSNATTNNYIILEPDTFNRDKGDVKLDYDVKKNLRLFTRYSQARFDAYDPGTILGTAGMNGDGHVYAPVKQIVGGATWTINAKSLLEARFGFSQMKAGKTPPLAGGPSMFSQFGITGLPTDPQYTGGITYELFSTGFSALGRLWTSPQYQNPTIWNPKVNYTLMLPGHTLKFGFEYTMLHVAQQDLHPVMGGDMYAAQMSGYGYNNNLYYSISPSLSVAGSPTGAQTSQTQRMFDYADFLLGYRYGMALSNAPVANIRDWGVNGYVQDDWKVNKRLTVNLGLRYEFATPIYEANNQMSNFNITTQTMNLAGPGNRYTINPNTKDFGPRLGAALSLDSKTVLRGGFGISYSHWNRAGSSYLTMNAPYGIIALQYVYPSLAAYRNTEDSFPANFVSPSSFSISNASDVALQYMPPDSPDTQVRSWFLSVQRDLGHSLLVDLAYVGNSGIHEVFFNDINQAEVQPNASCTLTSTSTCLTLPQRIAQGTANGQGSLYPSFGSIIGTLPWGTSNYNGLQAKVEKRFTSGLYVLESFTWSKAIDIAAQALDGGGNCDNCGNGLPSVQNIYNWQADRGISAYNHPFVNATSVVWTLPVGKGHMIGGNFNRVWNTALGGWQMTDILQARSGDPLTMNYSPDTYSNNQVSGLITIDGRNTYRPNLVPGNPIKNSSWAYNSGIGGIQYLNPSAYSVPQPTAPFGNSPRNAVRGFDFWQLDTGLTKDFPFTAKAHVQFRAEAFNLTNRTNYGDANTLLGGSFGVINSTLPARELQFAAKVVF